MYLLFYLYSLPLDDDSRAVNVRITCRIQMCICFVHQQAREDERWITGGVNVAVKFSAVRSSLHFDFCVD